MIIIMNNLEQQQYNNTTLLKCKELNSLDHIEFLLYYSRNLKGLDEGVEFLSRQKKVSK